MKTVLIDTLRGRICQVLGQGESTFDVATGLEWRADAPDNVTTDYTWDGSQYVAPPAPAPIPDALTPTEVQNAEGILAAITSEIVVVETEADALRAIVAAWQTTPPTQAQVLAHVERLTNDLARIGDDLAKLMRLKTRTLDSAGA